MEFKLRRDIRNLMLDAVEAHKDLEMFNKDHVVWTGQLQQDDLSHFAEDVKRLELDIIWMLSDCKDVSHRCQEVGFQPVLDSLHKALATLNSLFNNLKKVRMALKEAYIHPADLQQLVVDLGRFKKSLDQIQKHLQNGDNILNLIEEKRVLPYIHTH